MDSGIRHQVGLELSHIDIQSTVKSKTGSKGRNDLGNESVQVGVGRSLNVEISSADIIAGLIVQHNSNISMFKEGVSRQD